MLTYLYDVLFVELYQAYERMNGNETFYFFVQQYIDILIFCLQSHNSRIRYYIIKNEIIQHILKGLRLKNKIIFLIIAKFFKAIIQNKDEFLIRYLETKNLMKPLMDLFSNPTRKSGMFQSIMLDIISIIYYEDHETLKKQLEIYPIMSTSIIKNVTNHAKEMKNKLLSMRDFRVNADFFNEKTSFNKMETSISKTGLLNLNLLDEDDLDIDGIEKEDYYFNESDNRYEINYNENKKLKENGVESKEKEINLKEKRAHFNDEENILQMEQEMTRIKKVKLD